MAEEGQEKEIKSLSNSPLRLRSGQALYERERMIDEGETW
jgi:hypothetical protein